ncbi:hypothetical protein RZS28_02225 [Methylocapsa polymorpha]|uniref:Uncharacterized protein n=1 Tax=Methylocapsa polymorpha TaxID=3080828 RepID=A0ABZ0HS57_9HYPH|nr:hypothetical protein RZS28_02225 [Methylocapsa sp. RX1]
MLRFMREFRVPWGFMMVMPESSADSPVSYVETRKPEFLKSRNTWEKEKVTLPVEWRMSFNWNDSIGKIIAILFFMLVIISRSRNDLVIILSFSPVLILFSITLIRQWRAQRKFGNGVLTIGIDGFRDTRLSDKFIPWTACKKVDFTQRGRGLWMRPGETVYLKEATPALDGSYYYHGSALETMGHPHVYIEFNAAWSMREKISVHELFAALIAKASPKSATGLEGTQSAHASASEDRPKTRKLWVNLVAVLGIAIFPFALTMATIERKTPSSGIWIALVILSLAPSLGCMIWLLVRHAERLVNFNYYCQDRLAPFRLWLLAPSFFMLLAFDIYKML